MDEDQLNKLCVEIYPKLTRALIAFSGNHHDGEDLAQESLVRLVEHANLAGLPINPTGWAYRVGTNLARTQARRRRTEERLLAFLRQRPEPDTDSSTVNTLAAIELLQQLSHRQRSAVVARFILDFDVATTANALECQEGTVRALTHQAMTRLRQIQPDQGANHDEIPDAGQPTR